MQSWIHKNNRKGFTLVEVIVVAVIVAVLALVGIQLYQGYVVESQRNTAENLAASAAGFLQTVVNARDSSVADNVPDLDGNSPDDSTRTWNIALSTQAGAQSVTFTCPSNAKIFVITDSTKVRASVNNVSSTGTYRYR